MNIPIIKAGEVSDEKHCYITAKDGYFVKKTNKLYESITPVKEVPVLENIDASVKWLANNIPYSIIKEAHEFFKAIYLAEGSEGVVLLTYDNNEWEIKVPKQIVSPAHVDYDSSEFKGVVGSIHSHCMMNAFFSPTDDNDQASFDGVHIVLGKIMFDVPEIITAVYVNGYKHKCEPSKLISDLPEFQEPFHDWLSVVDKNNDDDLTEEMFMEEMEMTGRKSWIE